MKVAVLIPCYDEAKTIAKVVKDCKKHLSSRAYSLLIYVYDNNSTDDTAKLAKHAGAIVRREPRQGKGNVVRSMFRDVEADCYLMIDGDDTYPLDEGKKLIDAVIKDGADMVVGDRLSSTYFKENKRAFHGLGNLLVRKMINLLFGSHIRDMMTGFRAFSRDFAKTVPILAKGFDIEVEMTIFALGHNFYIKEIPIQYRNRPSGSVSKLNTYSDGIRVIRRILSLFEEYRPGLFFSILALLFFAISMIFGIPVFRDYFATGLVERFPTLIFAGFMLMIAVLMLVCGIILEVVAKKHRQLFELNLTNIHSKDSRQK